MQIADLISDVSLTLLRRESDWVSGAVEIFKSKDEDKADDMFTQVSIEYAAIELIPWR